MDLLFPSSRKPVALLTGEVRESRRSRGVHTRQEKGFPPFVYRSVAYCQSQRFRHPDQTEQEERRSRLMIKQGKASQQCQQRLGLWMELH